MSSNQTKPRVEEAPFSATELDYSLTGVNSNLAVEKGLAEADWYQCPVPRESMRALLARRDGPAVRDTLLWFGIIFGCAYATYALWGSLWALFPYLVYCALYASTSDSRWHEAGHGTAFKTDWMNNALYEIASFMIMRESTIWRWSHNRHHSDTIVVGRDPEIQVPRPADIKRIITGMLGYGRYPHYFGHLLTHAAGRMYPAEKRFVPEAQYAIVYRNARISLCIYAAVIAASITWRTPFPILFTVLPSLFGAWLGTIYSLTQHAGLAQNVLDHRLNSRTVYMNPVNRFLYLNMNYHVEHHMFPLVPYHALPKLHELVKDDCPTPYRDLFETYREIIPALIRQARDPAYHVKRRLPDPKPRLQEAYYASEALPDGEGWVQVCPAHNLKRADAVRFDHGKKTYALYRDEENNLYATDGICTHGNTHLADGLVKGNIIECPKHNGRFHLADGSPARAPACRAIATYPVRERDGHLSINIQQPGGAGARPSKAYELRVVDNRSVATFIKELLLEPVNAGDQIAFTPGDYLQFEIPVYDSIEFRDFDIPDPYAVVWERQRLFDLTVGNALPGRRNNYSLANNSQTERALRFNVRIAMPPPGQDCPPGVGSSYMFRLKPGDIVTAIGPFGDFHIKPTQREMVYIGGGAGMAPLRAHLSHLFETEKTMRKVSFWYGARSRQELFYEDYFENLAKENANFTFHAALSSPLPGDDWSGPTGFIHEVVYKQYLQGHPSPENTEYYLCGPPQMMRECTRMLAHLEVPPERIAFDEF